MPRYLVCLMLPALLLLAPPALAQSSTPGALEVIGEDGVVVSMPLEHTDVHVEITAFIARTVVEQTFHNPFDEPVEAVYTFPLGETAAVDDFEMTVGARTIRGEIHRREEARRIYETARSQGYRAALLEQERPNIFTQSVANLEPGEKIVVRLRTVEIVPYEAGIYRFTFPLVVGPRYIPGGAVADAPKISPPVLEPGYRSGHDVDIHVTLDAGVPVRSLSSPSHRVATVADGTLGKARLLDGDRIPNKDFILEWNVTSEEPALGAIAHRQGVDGFFTFLVQPKGVVEAAEAMPKEIVFVFDTSGSMSGIPLDLSRRFARHALRTLGPDDTFNLVRFAGGAEVYSESSLANTPAEIDRAIRWIDGLAGGGGTEMLSAFRAVFERDAEPDRLRMVVFLTDGYIGNETQIFAAVQDVVGEARIFGLGIGSSVNHHLLRGMADIGRGAYTFIPGRQGGEEAVDRFRSWVTRPYLTDIEIDWGALPVLDLVPGVPRDLYSGQTLAVVGRYAGAGEGEVTVRGRLGGRYWEQTVHVSLPGREEGNEALSSVWARRRIRELELSSPNYVTPAIRAEITTLALEYRLMSAYTSFVAVDDAEIVNPGGEVRTVHEALPMPQGVSYEGVFGTHGPPAVWPEGWTPPEDQVPITLVEPEVSLEQEMKRLRAESAVPARFKEPVVHEGHTKGRLYQNVITMAPGVSDSEDKDESVVHGSRSMEFAPLVAGVAPGERRDADTSSHVADAALRVLADLADDGILSRAEGRPALAALLAAQDPEGRVTPDPNVNVVATWALAEAAAALPDDPWVTEAAEKAVSRLGTTRPAEHALLRLVRHDTLSDEGAARARADLLDVLRAMGTGSGQQVDRLRAGLGSGNLKLAG